MASSHIFKSEDYYRHFTESIRSPFTLETYKGKLRTFMAFQQIPQGQYSQLIDGKSVIGIQEDIFRFISSLKARHYSWASQKAYFNAINHFYTMNDVILNRKRLSRYLSNDDVIDEAQKQEDRCYTTAEIAKLLEFADIRTRVMILLMASAGVRLGSLALLKKRDLIPVDKHNLYQIRVYSNSKSNTRYTFCTPECRKAIDSYFDYRKQAGERLEEKSPLLRRDFDSDDWVRAGAADNIKKISREAVKRDIRNVLYKSGLRSPVAVDTNTDTNTNNIKLKLNNKHPVAMTHGFRKFFDTTCTNAGMNPIYVEWCMGHSLPGVKDSYFKPRVDSNGVYIDILEGNDKSLGYIAAIDMLTIDDSQRLRRQVHTLNTNESEIDKLKEKAKEYEAFKSSINPQLEELQRHIVQINNKIGMPDPDNLDPAIGHIMELGNDKEFIENAKRNMRLVKLIEENGLQELITCIENAADSGNESSIRKFQDKDKEKFAELCHRMLKLAQQNPELMDWLSSLTLEMQNKTKPK